MSTEPSYEPRRVGEIEKSILDNRKAFHVFNWRNKYSLSEGLTETIQYYSELFSYKLQKL